MSKNIAILGFRNLETDGGFSRREYLTMSDPIRAVRGTIDDCEPKEAKIAVKELYERLGYETEDDSVIDLGGVNYSFLDVQLYAIEIPSNIDVFTNICEWMKEHKAVYSPDPLISSIVSRLNLQ